MKVKLCDRCPYAPSDIMGNYNINAEAHLCVGCDEKPATLARYPRDDSRDSRKARRAVHFREGFPL